MLPVLALPFLLASGLSAQRIEQAIHVDGAGTAQIDSRPVDAGTSTMRLIQAGGQVAETSWRAEARVLIELEARAVLDRVHPGSLAAAARQREQLARDLMALDARMQTRIPSRVTRTYHTLFSGVAATVDSAAVAEIRRLPNVAAVYEDVEVRANLAESVPQIGAPAVWSTYGVTGAGVKVAVIDTGIDYTHPDLGGCLGPACKVAGGYDFVHDDDDPNDDHGHGTHVAGIIAADGEAKGVAPGATLLAYKVLNNLGYGLTSDIIAAVEQAVLDGAKVANLSLGGPGYAGDPASQAIDNATAAGMLSVVSAGNSGPSYFTVSSPGVARTALTVGAADKSWAMASFSSRGYVVDGDRFVMKPEVVAPGVNILSTVPKSGMLGSPKGYLSLSGTSMAAPHVAGSAALLLQWNAAQTPEELKDRLAGSARPIAGTPFTRGAGGIDLVAAFGASALPSRTHIELGVVDVTTGTVTKEQTISIRNAAAVSQTFSFSADGDLPAGATLEIIPASATIAAGQSAEVTLRLRVNAAVTPEAPEPMAWSTTLVVSGGGQTARVPAYFFKGAVLTLSLDGIPWIVDLLDAAGSLRYLNMSGPSLTTVVKPGKWDVIVFYLRPLAVVIREQQDVQGHLTVDIARSQATHALVARPVDDAGQPLRAWDFRMTLTIGMPMASSSYPGAVSSTFSDEDFLISDVSSRYLLAFGSGGPDETGTRYFITGWSGRGLSADVTLPMAGVPFRRLAQAAAQPAGTASARLWVLSGSAMKTSWGAIGDYSGTVREGELSRTVYLQSSFAPGPRLLPVFRASLEGLDGNRNVIHTVDGSDIDFSDVANLRVGTTPFFDLTSPPRAVEAVLGPAVERWDVETTPTALPLQFRNSGLRVSAPYDTNFPSWFTHTMSRIQRVANAQPTFTLSRNGTTVGTYPVGDLNSGISSPAGPHELRSSFGPTEVVASFDTSKSDLNPPSLTRFRIEQNGIRTAAPYYPSKGGNPTVRFRATDDVSLASLTLECRPNGTATWTPVTLTGTAPDYEALLQLRGWIDLRVTATDSSGNTFQEQWTPAVIVTAPTPPGPPASLTATRSGSSSVSLSWTPAASNVGIARYRIERSPGGQTFTTTGNGTSFLDTSGLVPGSAYFYRVSAIDLEDAVSTPSPYDVATLVDLQDDPIVPFVTIIRGAHVADLRRAIDAVRQAAGLGRLWTDYTPPGGLIRASHLVELRDRLNEARAAMQLPAVQWSDPVDAGQLPRARSVNELRDGVR
jgi:subtilisin family serine protease